MSTGSARTLLACVMLFALGGCATSEPPAILSAAELESMIRIEIRPLETDRPGIEISDETAVAAIQP